MTADSADGRAKYHSRKLLKRQRKVVLSKIRQTDTWLSFGLAFIRGYGSAASFVLAKTWKEFRENDYLLSLQAPSQTELPSHHV